MDKDNTYQAKVQLVHTAVEMLHAHTMPGDPTPGTETTTRGPSTHHRVKAAGWCSTPHLVSLLSLLLLHEVLVQTLAAGAASEVLSAQGLGMVLLRVGWVSHVWVWCAHLHGWVSHGLGVPVLVLPGDPAVAVRPCSNLDHPGVLHRQHRLGGSE